MSISSSIRWLLVLAVVLTPIFSVGELAALFSGLLRDQVTALTPVYLKLLKDAILILCILLLAVRAVIRGSTSKSVYALPVAMGLTVLLVARAVPQSPLLALAGLRWIAPLLLGLLLVNVVDERMMKNVSRTLVFLFLVHFFMQVVETFLMSQWYGPHPLFPQLAARAPGIFLIPNTAGFFAVVTVFFTYFFIDTPWMRWAVWILAPLSVILTMSATATVVLAIIALGLASGRYFKPTLLAMPAFGVLLLLSVPLLSGRYDVVTESLGTRVRIFSYAAQNIEIIPGTFGAATSSGFLLASQLGIDLGTRLADSTYAGILINTGLAGSILFAGFALSWAVGAFTGPRRDVALFTLIYGLYGATTSLTEAFPMNFLLAIGFAWYVPVVVRQWSRISQALGPAAALVPADPRRAGLPGE